MKKATLLFLIKDDEILLAMKKRGYGEGRWNGVGGKPELNETIEQTAIRECKEEIEVTPLDITKVALLKFIFPEHHDWNQEVTAYTCKEWDGEPRETEEMAPKWFHFNEIPYEKMWQDDKHWLPEILRGRFVDAEFIFDNNNHLISKKLT